jgi:hypothetical protein
MERDKLLAILESFKVRYTLTEGEEVDAVPSEYFDDIVNDIIESVV